MHCETFEIWSNSKHEFAIKRDICGQENCNILILLNKLDTNGHFFVIIYFKYFILYTNTITDIITWKYKSCK